MQLGLCICSDFGYIICKAGTPVPSRPEHHSSWLCRMNKTSADGGWHFSATEAKASAFRQHYSWDCLAHLWCLLKWKSVIAPGSLFKFNFFQISSVPSPKKKKVLMEALHDSGAVFASKISFSLLYHSMNTTNPWKKKEIVKQVLVLLSSRIIFIHKITEWLEGTSGDHLGQHPC